MNRLSFCAGISCAFSLAVAAVVSSSTVAKAADTDEFSIVQIVDEVTHQGVRGALVFVGDKIFPVNSTGEARLPRSVQPVTLSVAFWDGKLRRVETFHDLESKSSLIVRVPNSGDVRREAVFSVGLPFGPMQKQARALVLLPQPAYDSGGMNFGHYDKVRLYQDQLQSDGRISLMLVALDENLLPWKYGYALDLEPEILDESHFAFVPPKATDMDHERQLVRWRKAADPVGRGDANSACDFKAPPFTECGLYPDKGGIFSWINVWRKGELFHAPGAFLPARTVGANPLMALPDSQIELAGHDDPLGFAPFNFARHRFLRYTNAPSDQVEIRMPNIVIGTPAQQGADAIAVDADLHGVHFSVQAVGESTLDSKQLHFGKSQLIWVDDKSGVRTIWNQYFEPRIGETAVGVAQIPHMLNDWLPNSGQQTFENAQVWLYGSDAVASYSAAMAAYMSGVDPIRLGENAFQVTRWR